MCPGHGILTRRVQIFIQLWFESFPSILPATTCQIRGYRVNAISFDSYPGYQFCYVVIHEQRKCRPVVESFPVNLHWSSSECGQYAGARAVGATWTGDLHTKDWIDLARSNSNRLRPVVESFPVEVHWCSVQIGKYPGTRAVAVRWTGSVEVSDWSVLTRNNHHRIHPVVV